MTARLVAYEAFREILHYGGYSNLVLKKKLSGYGEADKSFVTALVYGTVEKLITLDYQIKPLLNINKTPQAIMDILRLGAYQLFYMNSVPDFAACSQMVELAKSLGLNASLVNGVMRNLARKGLNLPAGSDDIDALSVIYSIPVYLLEKWHNDYGGEVVKNLARFRHDNLTSIWPNPDKTDSKALSDELKRIGAHVLPGVLENTLKVGFAAVARHDLYKSGYYSIQGEGAIIASIAAMPPEGGTVLDMCAAPGGKSVYIAKHNKECEITAWDLHPHRVELINANIKRIGCDNITTEAQDALVFRRDCVERFDSVLVDAPCSGLGTIWTKPEIRYRIKQQDISELARTQERILANAVRYVKKGGILVYSTCTLSADENERAVEKLLAQHPEFSLESIPGIPDDVKQAERGKMLTLFPYLFGTEGFFVARLRRCE
ncbi:MAG TPA: 16S rRNA (cytosine(967)-C(5))-methyltransferase RsmB [Clostridia bacterium]|nr:16S rRNA (cytosine(967)-C(5))-methyltransferase RsmB [Clostridia bacterium]